MKSLYSEKDFTLTEDGHKLDLKTLMLLEPMFKEFIVNDYSPREISQIMQAAITVLELEAVLATYPRRKETDV